MTSPLFRIAFIGRPNVGKSTLFNKMAGKQLAIVDDRPGVTRDWREAEARIAGRNVTLIDTAGLEESFDDSIQGRMRRQTEEALVRADLAVFMIDGRAGVTPMDLHFAEWIRKQDMNVLLVVNKVESKAGETGVIDSYSLGLGEPIAISAEHSHGKGDLIDAISGFFPEEDVLDVIDEDSEEEFDWDLIEGDETYEFEDKDAPDQDIPIKLAIAGRPNVGKSTLVNALLGENRVMTGPEAGITRDSIATDWTFEGQKFKLVDTAGLRKKAKIVDPIEKMAATDSLRAIRLAKIVVLVLDSTMSVDKQDIQIANHVLNEGRALVIAANKWDALSEEERTHFKDHIAYRLETSLAQVRDLPFVSMSALKGKNLNGLLKKIMETYETWNSRVSTGPLNRWLSRVEQRNPAPLTHGRPNRLRYIAQINTRPPTFALWVSRPQNLPGSYKRFLMNALREELGITGVPIRLMLRTSKNPYRR